MTFARDEYHIAGTCPRDSFLDCSRAIMLNPDIGMINNGGSDLGDDHARIFRSAHALSAASARSYPNGIQAWVLRAASLAQRGDGSGAAAAFDELNRQGYTNFYALASIMGPVRSDPRVKAEIASMALQTAERLQALGNPVPSELYLLARALFELGRLGEVAGVLERALEIGGPRDPQLRAALREAQIELERRKQLEESPAE